MNQVAPQQQQQLTPLQEAKSQVMSEKNAHQFQMALPKHISIEKFQRVVVTALTKNPDLALADRESLFISCTEAAADGLMPDGREAALVVYKTKVKRGGKDQWIKKVQYIPMVAGIYKKALNSGLISMMSAHCVYEKDVFECALGTAPSLIHKPDVFGDRGKMVGVYASVKYKDGSEDFETMSMTQINHVKQSSKTGNNGPWADHFEEMARKTAIRRIAKRLPLTPDLERLINRMDAMYEFEQGKEQKQVAANTVRPALAHASADDQMNAFAGPVIDVDAEEAHDADGVIDEPEAEPTAEPEKPKLSAAARSAMNDLSQAQDLETFEQIVGCLDDAVKAEIPDYISDKRDQLEGA